MASGRSSSKQGAQPGSGSSSSLVSGLVKRLNQVERELQAATARTKQQENEIALLKTQLAAAKQHPGSGSAVALTQLKQQQRKRRQWGGKSDASSESVSLREAERWRQQAKRAWSVVGKMKDFLQDYGLVWVGDDDDGSEDAVAGGQRPGGAEGDEAETKSADNVGASSGADGGRRVDPGYSRAQPAFHVDMARLRRKVEKLNQLSTREGSTNDRDGGAPSNSASEAIDRYCDALSRPEADELTLRVFRDGVQLGKFPARSHGMIPGGRSPRPEFHSFSTEQAKRIVQDICDGYFPSQLRYRYPNGVRLDLEDRYDTLFSELGEHRSGPNEKDSANRERSGGERQQATGTASASAAEQPQSNVHGLSSLVTDGGADGGEHAPRPPPPMSKANFLQKLPAAIIRNGKVIEVRNDVASMLSGQKGAAGSDSVNDGPIALTETIVGGLMRRAPAAQAPGEHGTRGPPPSRGAGASDDSDDGGEALSSDDELDDCGRDPGPMDVATIQVKTEDRLQTYVLKLAQTSTVGKIYSMIDKHRGGDGSGPRGYELRGGFPPRLYADMDTTLLDAGLVPNASLFMREVPA